MKQLALKSPFKYHIDLKYIKYTIFLLKIQYVIYIILLKITNHFPFI